jgi:hypothetical protein
VTAGDSPELARDRLRRLGKALIRRRQELGFASRAAFLRTRGADVVPGALAEGMVRRVEDLSRLAPDAKVPEFEAEFTWPRVERMYDLPEGSVPAFLSGATPTLIVPSASPPPGPEAELLAKYGISKDSLEAAIRVLRALCSAPDSSGSRGERPPGARAAG